jgi:hypothetical protein
VKPGTGGTGGTGAAGANPSTGTNGTAPGASSNAACDPDSGTCDQAAGAAVNAADQQIPGVPVDASSDFGDSLEVLLMVAASILLLGLGLLPPIIAQAGRRRDQRERPGGWQ